MKKLLLIALLALSTETYAACEKYEYLELKDMPDSELLETYCKTSKALNTQQKLSNDSLRNNGSSKNYAEEVCWEQVSKISRVYKRRLGTFPKCTDR